MPETIAGLGTYFTAGEGAAAALTAEDIAVAGTSVVGTGTAMGGATAGVAGTAGTVGGGGLLQAIGTSAATAAATAGVNQALAPKRPDLPKPLAMPDPAEQERARQRAIIEQLSRRGRASTILSDSGPGTLGG